MRAANRQWLAGVVSLFVLCCPGSVLAEAVLSVTVGSLDAENRFTDSAAFCPPKGSGDVSPLVSWSSGPVGTRSYILLMSDADVPRDLSAINKPGIVIPADAPRMRVFHWVLVDIPAHLRSIPAGAESAGLVAGGKSIGLTAHGLRGANVFTTFLSSVKGMAGTYGGYDGPCPPVNDQRTHRYVVEIFAVDITSLSLSGAFTGEDVEGAMQGHVLARGATTADYSLGKLP